MKPETIAQLLALLHELKTKPITKEHQEAGICSFLDLEMYRRHKVYLDSSWNYGFNSQWEHFSGMMVYPVPDPEDKRTASAIYHDCHNHWVGAYGELRMELIGHYIKCLEAMQ